ncbi:hypothetical protein [Dactylosporangium sp. NPDC005555]|uniref:hypothetical protein n=1 Tax=Dactylosporangium sp. NPDC005555 TaxID=3154889 RepID=UPI0033BDD9DE
MGESTASDEVAGEQSSAYLDLFLTIAEDHCGGYLYVDLRDGLRRGGVGYCSGEENHDEPVWDSYCSGEENHDEPVWGSTAHLLESVADAMDAAVPCTYDGWLPEPDQAFGVGWRQV